MSLDDTQTMMFRQANAEHAFAASAFTYPLYTLQECGWLDAAKFVDDGVRQFWQALKDTCSSDVSEEEAQSIAIQVAMAANIYHDISRWQKTLSYTPMPQAYASEINRRHYMNAVGRKVADLHMAVVSFDDKAARRIIDELHEYRMDGATKLPDAMQVADKFEAALEAGGRNIDTYVPLIDAALGGLERQTLTGVAARPSVGKTAFVLQIARNGAEAGNKVIFASLEMSAINLWARMACPLAGLTWRDVRAGKYTPEQKAELLKFSRGLADRLGDRLRVIDQRQTTETLWQAVAEYKPDLVVADHLRLFKDEHQSEVKRLGCVTQNLKDMGKAHDCAVLLAIQLNRALESRSDKRPNLADLRDSGEIEENLDVCLMMYRDSIYNPPEYKVKKDPTEIWVRKFRDGPSNIQINLQYDLETQWFEEKPK